MYLTFFFLSQNVIGPDSPFTINGVQAGGTIWSIVRLIYIACILTTLIASLGNRPQGSRAIYLFVMIVFGIIMVLMIFLATWTIIAALGKQMQTIQ